MSTAAYSAAADLVCVTCGAAVPIGPHLAGCESCRRRQRRGALAVRYAYTADDARILGEGADFWSDHRFLPVTDPRSVVTLGEGRTPLVPLPEVAGELGLAYVGVKLESLNPTLSYKDRANAVSVAAARQFGYDRICCASSGNHGVSVAAYAAAAGLRSLVLLPPEAPPSAAAEVRQYGGVAVVVDPGEGEHTVATLIERLHREHGWFISNRNAPLVRGRRFGNPFGLEGYKTIAYEIWRQLGGRLPSWCCFPVGGGDGLAGLWRGFREIVTLGLAPRAPRMVACQPEAGASVVRAWRRGLAEVEPVETGPTVALSLVDRQSGDHALRAVRESGGKAVAIAEAALLDAVDELGRRGISLEPSAAAGLAALRALGTMGWLEAGETALFVGTGAGLRWPATYSRTGGPAVPRIPPHLEALREVTTL